LSAPAGEAGLWVSALPGDRLRQQMTTGLALSLKLILLINLVMKVCHSQGLPVKAQAEKRLCRTGVPRRKGKRGPSLVSPSILGKGKALSLVRDP
jgi:hypothetical protein